MEETFHILKTILNINSSFTGPMMSSRPSESGSGGILDFLDMKYRLKTYPNRFTKDLSFFNH